MLKQITALDNELKKAYVETEFCRGAEVPEKYHSVFCRVAGAGELGLIFFEKFLWDLNVGKILVIGLHGGRDYWGAVARGFDVHGFDLVDFPFPQVSVGNIEGGLPYSDHEFDAVIMCEVLEHLIEDSKSLKDVCRVLKPDGRLVVSIPFVDSNDSYHVRIHDQKSIVHLLSACGFEVVELRERPGIFFKSSLNYVLAVFVCFYFSVSGKNIYSKTIRFVADIEYKLAGINLGRKFFKMFGKSNWGGNILALKTKGSPRGYLQANVEAFRQVEEEI